MRPQSRLEATIDDLSREPGKAELVNGRIVRMPPASGLHGYAVARIVLSLADYARRTGSGHAIPDNVGFVVKPGERLLPHMLRDRGFATAAVVSSFVLRRATGIDQGFEFFDGDLPPADEGTSTGPLRRDGRESEAIAERWLDSQRSSRVFLFLHLYEPHAPYAPPPQYAEYPPYDGAIARISMPRLGIDNYVEVASVIDLTDGASEAARVGGGLLARWRSRRSG